METLVKDETKAPAKTTQDAVARTPERREEVDELLRIKRNLKIDADRVPCPCCGVLVEMASNRCPFCESDIAAATALARETLRRLRELSGELDALHAARPSEEPPKRRGFFERLKYLFEGDPEPEPAPRVDPHAKRLLGNLSPGDSIKVLDEEGPWLKVKTQAGDIGWVYSTVRKHT